MEAYVPVIHSPSATSSATTVATSMSFATPPYPSLSSAGSGCSFIAATPISIATQPVKFTVTADSRASGHFIDNQLLPVIELKMSHYMYLNPSLTIKRSRKASPLWRWSRGSGRSSVGPSRLEALCAASRYDPTRARQAPIFRGIIRNERGQHDYRQQFVSGHGCICYTPT